MVELLLFKNFFVALALGAFVGLEREYHRKKGGHQYAGIRTFPLIALFGALAAYFGEKVSPWALVGGMLLMGIIILISYFTLNQGKHKYMGATSEVAGFITFFIGALCYYGEITFAAVLTITMTIILYARSLLHNFAQKLTRKEIQDTLKFAVVAFVILPFLPNQAYGPWGIFNPYIIWLMVVFISGISFVGYIAMKFFGEKGVPLAGALGGLVSSTAVTTSFASRSKKEKKIFRALALGVIIANGLMFFRVLIEVFVLNIDLFGKLFLPLTVLGAVSVIFSLLLFRKLKKIKAKINLESPFTLGPALKFGAFFAIVLALAQIGHVFLASKGIYIVSLISGLADVDAITVSLSQLAKGSLALETAKNGIIVAALTNVAVKGGIAWWFGGKKFGKLVLSFFSVLILLGLVFLFVL